MRPNLFDRIKIIPKSGSNIDADVIQMSKNKFCAMSDQGKTFWIVNNDPEYSWINISDDRSQPVR